MSGALAAGVSAALVMGLTAAHHGYGAVRFDTPWRNHVVHQSLWVVLAIGVCVGVHLRGRSSRVRRAGLLAASLLILVAPVGWIGIFEGGYNHVVKNLIYYAGGSRDSFVRLFPSPTLRAPDVIGSSS